MIRFLIANLALAAAPVAAQTAAPDAATTGEKPREEKRICRSTPETGSLIRRNKICRTAREWEAAYTEARQRGNDARQLGYSVCGAGTPC